MLYQTIKFYFARFAVTLFLMFGLGFASLFFIHEVALPNLVFNDLAIQWSLFLICMFFGFIGYGMLGEQRFYNALHQLKNISPDSGKYKRIEKIAQSHVNKIKKNFLYKLKNLLW